MALRRGQHAGRFALRLAELAVGSARDAGHRPRRLSRHVVDKRVGERIGVFGDIEAGGIEPIERIVAGRGLPRHLERIKAPDGPLVDRARAVTRAFSPLGASQNLVVNVR